MSDEQMSAVEKFLRDLTDPECFGLAVSGEVRREALRLLAEVFK